MPTAGDRTELFGPLSELHVHGGGWKFLDASETSGPRDSRSFCFDASRRAGRNCALGCAKVESPQCPLLQSTVYYVGVESRSKITFYTEATVNRSMRRSLRIFYTKDALIRRLNSVRSYTHIYLSSNFFRILNANKISYFVVVIFKANLIDVYLRNEDEVISK